MLISLWGHLSYFIKDFFFFLLLLCVTTILSFYLLTKLNKSHIPQNKKNLFLVIIFSFLSFIYIYSAFEVYFRYVFDESDSLGFLKITEKWDARHVVYNNFQRRDNKDWKVAKTPGVVRIGVMGDSNAFGYGVKDVHKRFSNLLEDKLKMNGYSVEIYNFGVPGLGTDGEIKEYQRVKNLNFDILIWQYFLNDAESATKSAGTKVLQSAQNELPAGIVGYLEKNSYFFNYIYWHLAAKYIPTFIKLRNADLEQYNIPEVFQHHKELIDAFSYDLESRNKKIVVLIMPFLYFFPNYPPNAIEIHRKMDTIFINDGATKVLDVYDFVKGKNSKDLVVGPYDSHPNEYVHKLAADKLYEAIAPLLFKTGNGQTLIR